MTQTNDQRLARLHDLHERVQAVAAETARLVQEVVDDRASILDAAEGDLLALIDELRAAKVSWAQIAEGAGFPSPAAAKVWHQRARERAGLFKRVKPRADNREGTLSAAEAAAELGITESAFRYHVEREGSEVCERVEPVESWHNGKPATRYRLVG